MTASVLRPLEPLRHLLLRAAVLFALLRALLLVVGALSARAGAPSADSPLGIVLLTMILGYIDLRRRGEVTLWSNLGFSPVAISGIFASVAAIGEVVVYWWRA